MEEILKIPIPFEDIIYASKLVAEQENIKGCLKEAAKGAAWSGGMSIVGALVGGPVGMAAGGALGALVGYCTSKEFKPLHQLIQDMDEKDRARLASHMWDMLMKFGIRTAEDLATLVLERDSAAYNAFVKALRSFQV